MVDVFELVRETERMAEGFVLDHTVRASAADLGLDPRAGYSVYVTRDCVIVDKSYDSSMQYYGGFEYVNKEYRKEIGDYVFYMIESEDSRVAECIKHFYSGGPRAIIAK
jgi:hypothetical protein